jgi:hypothetical protein
MTTVPSRKALRGLATKGWLPACVFLACCCAAGLAGAAQAQAGELNLNAVLIWGTDEAKPKEGSYKELDAKVKKKLCRIFRWKNYFVIKEEKISLAPKIAKRLKLSSKCELELKYADDDTVEIKLFGEGRWTKTFKQRIDALKNGELAVLAGDDKDKYDDAWFVVLSVPLP